MERTSLYKTNSRIFGKHRPQYKSPIVNDLISKKLIDMADPSSFDLNTLSYESKFRYKDTEEKYYQFNEWEMQSKDLVHALANNRMGIRNEYSGQLLQLIMGLRGLDFEYMKEIIGDNRVPERIRICDKLQKILGDISNRIQKNEIEDPGVKIELNKAVSLNNALREKLAALMADDGKNERPN